MNCVLCGKPATKRFVKQGFQPEIVILDDKECHPMKYAEAWLCFSCQEQYAFRQGELCEKLGLATTGDY